MHLQPPKRVAVAITSNDGNTLCGFRTTAPPGDAEQLFASSVGRLRRAGQSEGGPVVLSIETARKNYASLQEAERGLEEALHLRLSDKPTVENPRQR
ncbi:MAG: hypothetical protein ACRBN8_24020 [Nannocystales bacterium]